MNTTQANALGLTAQHIATNLNSYEAARSSFFVLVVDGLDNLLKTNYAGGVNDTDAVDNMYDAAKAQEILKLSVTKCPVPSYKVGVMQYRRGNDVVNFAGLPEFQSGSLTVEDTVGLDTKSILMSWLRLAYDPHTLKGGRMKDYKKTCTLIEYTQDYEQIRSWTLYGCFITGLEESEFDKEAGDDKRQITAEFVYDRALMELPEEENI